MTHRVVLVVGEDVAGALHSFSDEAAPDGESGWFDSWEIGGRWSGMLAHRNGSRVDRLQVRDLDWGAMERQLGEHAAAMWDHVSEQPIREAYYQLKPRDLFIDEISYRCITTSGYVKDGEIVNGDGGMLGEPSLEWGAKMRRMVEGLPPDEWITVVDLNE